MLRSYEETDYANARRRLYASQQLARSGLLLQLSGAWRNTERTGGRPRVATEVPVTRDAEDGDGYISKMVRGGTLGRVIALLPSLITHIHVPAFLYTR